MRDYKSSFSPFSGESHGRAGKKAAKKNTLQKSKILFKRVNFVVYYDVFVLGRCKMGKKKGGSGGFGSIFLTILKIIVFVFLLANFCWEGKPLWKHIVPSAGKTIEKSEKVIKKEAEKAVKKVSDSAGDAKKAADKAKKAVSDTAEDAKKAAEKTVDKTKKTIEKTKDSIKEDVPDISVEDEKKLEEILKKKMEK